MYYIANAALLSNGYKVGEKISHKVTSDALIEFIRDKLRKDLITEYENTQEDALEIISSKTDNLLQTFDYERETLKIPVPNGRASQEIKSTNFTGKSKNIPVRNEKTTINKQARQGTSVKLVTLINRHFNEFLHENELEKVQ